VLRTGDAVEVVQGVATGEAVEGLCQRIPHGAVQCRHAEGVTEPRARVIVEFDPPHAPVGAGCRPAACRQV
jgi:hypothetical protein